MREEVTDFTYFDETIKALDGDGVFLVTHSPTEGRSNVMTIGWGTLGRVWGKHVFIVMVRPSRFSYRYIEETGEFSVNLPGCRDESMKVGDMSNRSMKEALEFCGSYSGRDMDKVSRCGFTMEKGIKISVPYIRECPVHYECRTLHKNRVDKNTLLPSIIESYYPKDDYHTVYFGEIVGVYREKGFREKGFSEKG